MDMHIPCVMQSLRSSQSNWELVNREYKNNPIQRWAARWLGDEVPWMRDDMIRRNNNGEGALEGMVHSWQQEGGQEQ